MLVWRPKSKFNSFQSQGVVLVLGSSSFWFHGIIALGDGAWTEPKFPIMKKNFCQGSNEAIEREKKKRFYVICHVFGKQACSEGACSTFAGWSRISRVLASPLGPHHLVSSFFCLTPPPVECVIQFSLPFNFEHEDIGWRFPNNCTYLLWWLETIQHGTWFDENAFHWLPSVVA